MPNTFTLIASSTVGSGGAASISFNSIPATYTDLVLKVSLRKDTSYDRRLLQMTFNGVTSGYSDKSVYGTGSATSSGSFGGGVAIAIWDIPAALSTANTFSNIEIYCPNYTSSSNKSVSADGVQENNATTADAGLVAGLSNITSAISSINLYTDQGGNFVQYSTAYLYGVKNA